jgi:hypothetical protein
MLYKLGRFLQLLGLLIVPAALAGNAARQDLVDLKMMLFIAGLGMAVFALGWWIQQAARPQ